MSREEILSSFHIILIAGSETSATTMTGIFNHLCMPQNKSILERLTREIRAKYASEEDIITATVKNPEQFPYLDAVINEGLRMCHPVPSGVARVAPPGGDEYAGFFIPEGVSTYLPICLPTTQLCLSSSLLLPLPFPLSISLLRFK